MHGFDEFFGNLYHLNAEEEAEQLDYPGQRDPEYTKKYGPRGVFHAWAVQAAKPFMVEHLKSLQAFPPRQGADTLSLHKALETAMAKLEQPIASSN
jgi:arylsulfatase A-like enzyme